MKKTLISTLLAAATATSFANHPDSVYVKTVHEGPGSGVRVEYSADKHTWIPIEKQLFSSDFGEWGRQKKMYSPVLRYDGKKFYAEFLLGEDIHQYAKTESEDMFVWKPQDYPFLTDDEFKAKKKELEKESVNNIMKVPYAVVESLKARSDAAVLNGMRDGESMRLQGLEGKGAIRSAFAISQSDRKDISSELFGIFFEDINYSADGGLYAELIQNRDFEYSNKDRGEWNGLTGWHMEGNGTELMLRSDYPLHENNPHYAVLKTSRVGAKLVNDGWDGIPVKKGQKYNLTIFVRNSYHGRVKVSIESNGKTLASAIFTSTPLWDKQKAVLTATESASNARLVIEPLTTGDISIDFVSLFPADTYKGRANGLRKDLATALADMKPQFVRFPGGCMSHGNGIDNIYHWQSTVGELWEREPDFNTWGYHQTRGLGFYEYFQFCEDIGAEPLPVLAAGVPCQNSSRGGHGQQGGIPFEKDLNGKPSPYTYNGRPLTMESYLQELINLIEWANGNPSTSVYAQMRAKAGHAKPFGLKYLGIGNEDLLGDVFNERFTFLYNGIKARYPEITVVGTVGPFWEGSDYEYGWKEAKRQHVPIVDEHYYNPVGWYLNHQDYYDKYDRNGTKVYLGEWASKGNNLSNALAEAIHITNVERNADVVVMSSYAPLLAKEGHTQWNPDLIYFNNNEVKPTPNYYVQKMCGQNAGTQYVYSSMKANSQPTDENRRMQSDINKRVKASVVVDKKTNELIVKLVNAIPVENTIEFADGSFDGFLLKKVVKTTLSGKENDRNVSAPTTETIDLGKELTLPAYSFTVIRLQKDKKFEKNQKKELKKRRK